MLSTVIAFTSCGSDDDTDDPTPNNNSTYSIIGTWKYIHENNSNYTLLTFYADGTVTNTEYHQGKISYEQINMYTYANNIVTLIDDDGDSESVIIHWQDKNKFFVKALDSDVIMVYIRQ